MLEHQNKSSNKVDRHDKEKTDNGVVLVGIAAPVLLTAGLAKDCRVGLRWHLCCCCPISKPRPFLGFSQKIGVGF